jgi:hypothetical protein
LDRDSLLALFRRLALVGAPLLIGGCGNGIGSQGCPDEMRSTTVSLASFTDAGVGDGGLGDGGLDDLCRRALPSSSGQRIEGCELVTVDGGLAVHVIHTPYCVGGRRPAGLAASLIGGTPSALGLWLATTAHLEAASVDAFEIMSAELDAHGAPRPLVDAALAAADDERRHARVMTHLARRHGAHPADVRVTRHPTRDLETIAAENVAEGCVRETFAALVACRQALAAEDVAVRRAMNRISVEETRHAALAWAVDEWAGGRLTEAARRRTRDVRRETIVALLREIADEASDEASAELRAAAGLPAGDEATQMASALFAKLS